MKRITATESQEQIALFQWAATMEYKYPELALMFHIPNGGVRNIVTATRLKAEGLKAGVPDIFLPVSKNGWHGLFIEMKAQGGKVSESQRAWQKALIGQEYRTVICRGWEEAREEIECYLLGIPF